jgi:hypothetical protein
MRPYNVYSLYLILFVLYFGTVYAGQHFRQVRRWAAAGVVLLTVLAALVLATQSEPRPAFVFSDFLKAYYPAGVMVRVAPHVMYNHDVVLFVNLPILAYLFTPLSQLSQPAAVAIVTVCGIAAIVAAWLVLCRLTGASGWAKLTLAGIVCLNGPLYYSLRIGNLTHFVLLLLAGAALCQARGRGVVAGILLGLSAWIKLPLFLLGGYFLFQRRWRVLAGFGITVAVVAAASVLLFGVGLHKVWRAECLQPFAGRPMVAFNVQSASGFLARLTTDRDPDTSPLGVYDSWKPIDVSWRFKAVHLAFVALLGGASLWVCRQPTPPGTFFVEGLEWSLFVCLALVVSPISWTHYYLLLLLPVCLCLGGNAAFLDRPRWSILLMASVALVGAPVISFRSANLLSRALVSHHFLGGLLLWGMLFRLRLQADRVSASAALESWHEGHRPLTVLDTALASRGAPKPVVRRAA